MIVARRSGKGNPMEQTLEFDMRIGGKGILARIDRRQEEVRAVWDGISHNHARYEFHVILDGCAKLDVEGKEVVLSQNQAMVIAPGQYHCPVATDQALDRFALTFSVEEGPLLQALQTVVPTWKIYPVTEEILLICRDIFAECAAAGNFGRDMLQCHLTRLLICNFRLLGLWPMIHDREKPRSVSLADGTDVIDSWFSTHMRSGEGAEDLAARLYLSRRHLNRLLQEHYGMNFREKMNRTRLNQAVWLLRYTDLPVCAVAEEVGYSNPSSIYHNFRENFGMTPEQYRLKSREE